MMDYSNQRSWGPKPRYPFVQSVKKNNHSLISIAGPCSIETVGQIAEITTELAKWNISYMRGGVYRAGTYPPDKFGLQFELLREWHHQCKANGIKNIVEVIDIGLLDQMEPYCDAFQVGARQMQNYGLLADLSQQDKPVSLKRHPGSTMDEFLGSAEYLCRHGKTNVMLIERGSSTHMNHVRWDLSISIIPAIKQITGLPVIVDASHGTGRLDLVEPMTLAGIAAGADGYLLEVHPEPELSISDRDQAYPLNQFGDFQVMIRAMHGLVGSRVKTTQEVE